MGELEPNDRSACMSVALELGTVVEISGSQARIELFSVAANAPAVPTVGSFLGIETGSGVIVGTTTMLSGRSSEGQNAKVIALVDLLGELGFGAGGKLRFDRGVTAYPRFGDPVRILDREALETIFSVPDDRALTLGCVRQNRSIPAKVDVKNLVAKHFAILGTTGVGKSSGVALILQQIAARPGELRIFLIDPHNEYGRCFGDKAQVLNPTNLKLPFWLFNFEEIVDVFFKGRPGPDEEVAILSDLILQARAGYDAPSASSGLLARRNQPRSGTATVDSPVPYRLSDLVAILDERLGKLENRASIATMLQLKARIESVRNDRRYAFMFESANLGGDTMADVIIELFSLQGGERNVTVMQLAGFPAEVVDSVVSVVSRMAFEFGLWSDGAFPLLFACEEAHRYAPADRTLGFGPTRKALSRIAKEGRKYGIYLGLVTQRASELDATILSQCSTVFAMRMGNEQDQKIIRHAVSDASANLLGLIPTLGTREALVFGEGVPIPVRFVFEELTGDALPRSEALPGAAARTKLEGKDLVRNVIERWRTATVNAKRKTETPEYILPDHLEPPPLRTPAPDPYARAPEPQPVARFNPRNFAAR